MELEKVRGQNRLKQTPIKQFLSSKDKQEIGFESKNVQENNFLNDYEEEMKEVVNEISPKSSSNLKRTPAYSLDGYEYESSPQTSEIPCQKELNEESDIGQVNSLNKNIGITKKKQTRNTKKNPIWNHFTKGTSDGIITCNYCIPKKSFSTKTHPSNLNYHLEHFHPGKITSRSNETQNVSNQQKISEFTHFTNPTKNKQVEFREDITKLLIGTNSASFLLENEIFCGFFQKWLPAFKIPYRKIHNQIVDQLYENKRTEIKDFFDNKLQSKVSLTFDGWSSVSGEHYFGITGKCLFENLKTLRFSIFI